MIRSNYTRNIADNFGLSVLQSAAFTFAVKTVLRDSQSGIACGAVAGVAAIINGLVNPLLISGYRKSQINFFHDAAYKIGIFFVAKKIVEVALPGVHSLALTGGLMAYLLIRGFATDFKLVDLNKNSVWVLL